MEKELQIVQIKIQVTKKYIIFLKFLVNLIDIVCKIHYHEDIDNRQCFSMFYLYVIYMKGVFFHEYKNHENHGRE